MDNSNSGRELLENVVIGDVQNPQYLIHRLPENAQLLGSDLLQQHNGLVVDIGGGDFIPVNYSSEDLLPQDLTEEDRNLAAALVAVQLSQQQKQQQVQDANLPSIVNSSTIGNKVLDDQHLIISDKSSSLNSGYLQIVGSESIYVEKETLPKLIQQNRFQSVSFPNNDTSILPVKNEDESEKRESDGDKTDSRSSKKSLPHKKRISKKLKKNCTIAKKIKCNLCEQYFPNSDDYAQHTLLCQTTITPVIPNPFSCQLCTNTFSDQLRFFEHLKSHYEPPNQASTPQTNTSTVSSATSTPQQDTETTAPQEEIKMENDQSILSTLLNLTCMVCSKTFRKQKTYEAHMKDVHGKCELNEFSEPEDLMEGIDVVVNDNHSDIEDDSKAWYKEDELQQTEEDLKELEAQDHVCHICKQPFPLRPLLLQHLVTCRAVTGNTEPTAPAIVKKKNKKPKQNLSCNVCDRVFTHRNSLMYHLKSHSGLRPHQCDTCGKSFFASSALKVHMRLHSGDKPYHCEECGRNFRQWGDLKYHMTSIHSTERQFQCEYCGKEFARKYSLVVHRRIHTGERNYKCEFCGKCFRASSYLQNHRRIHTGEKPHQCEVCGKPFRVRSDMKRHQKSHAKKSSLMRKLYTNDVQKEEKEELEAGSNDAEELQINVAASDAEILYEDPLATTTRDAANTIYTNGHQLFLVSYAAGEIPKVETSSWIQTSS